MCSGCVDEYVTESGEPRPKATDEMKALAARIVVLYTMPGCSMGGPIHVVTDDYNLEDRFLDPGDAYVDPERWDAAAVEWAEQILAALRPLSLPERAVTVDIAHDALSRIEWADEWRERERR